MATVWNAMEGNRCSRTDSPFHLRLFAEPTDDGRSGLSPRMTLWELYLEFFRPVCLESQAAAKKTIKQYNESIRYWKSITGDPPLDGIDDYVCALFVAELLKLPGIKKGTQVSPNTVRKHCVHVQKVLNVAGPKSPRERLGQSLVKEIPWLEKPRKRRKHAVDAFNLDELSLILDACKTAQAPRRVGVSPADWWRSLFVFDYNTGFRIGTLTAIRYEWIKELDDMPCPVIEIPGGQSYKGGDAHTFPLNSFAMTAIDGIRTERSLIFPWPHSEGWLHTNRRRILKAAGIPEGRRFGFHGVRKLHGTRIARINAVAGRLSLGHTNDQTFDQCYAHPMLLAEAAQQLPQPTQRRFC